MRISPDGIIIDVLHNVILGEYQLIIGFDDLRAGIMVAEKSSPEFLVLQLHRLADIFQALIIEDGKRKKEK